MEARLDYQSTPTGARFLRHIILAAQAIAGTTTRSGNARNW